MKAGKYSLCITRGTLFGPLQIACKDGAGEPVDLTGWTAHAQARSCLYRQRKIDLKPTITDPKNGVVTLQFDSEETAIFEAGRYKWDLLLRSPEGDYIGPILSGELIVRTPITQPENGN